MCVEIQTKDDILTSMEDLAKVVGRENIVMESGFDDDVKNKKCCLCNVNIEETAKKAGFNCRRFDPKMDEFYTDYFFYKTHCSPISNKSA